MINEKNLIRLIAIGPLLFIPSVIIIFTLLLAKINNDHLNTHKEKLQIDIKHAQSLAIKSKVNNLALHIAYRKSIIKKDLKIRVKKRVQNAYRVANSIYEEYQDTKTDKEIQHIIITALKAFSWNNDESFIWIINYNGILKLQPRYLNHLKNKSILKIKDLAGKFVIKEEIDICKTNGEGFLWDTFTKANSKQGSQYKQIAFVKAFNHYNWYFGSAEYLDTAKNRVDKQLLKATNEIRKFGKNYVFVFTDKGKILAHISSKYIGKNIADIDKILAKHVLDTLKTKQSIEITYDWFNEDTNIDDKKHAYLTKVPNSDWIIGSGYYESFTIKEALKQSKNLENRYGSKLKIIIISGIILIILSLIISYYLSRHIKMIFFKYKESITINSLEVQKLNETLEERVKERTKELNKAKVKLEFLATTDSLTNIDNRYSIMKVLKLEMERANRHKTPLCISMFDIDFFKKVNDTFGHDVGDEILVSLIQVVKKSLRDIDVIGRYGGEEFLVIMPVTNLDDAKDVSSRIRKAVELYKFDKVGKVTISIGLVQMQKNENFDTMFKRLDELLYSSKENGRNKVSF